eukprot:g58105.t1
MPSEDGLVEDAWTDMAEAPDLKGRRDAQSWDESMAQMRAGWKGSEEDLKCLQEVMVKEKEIFDPPRPGTVKHFEAHLRKKPGVNITHASRRSSLLARDVCCLSMRSPDKDNSGKIHDKDKSGKLEPTELAEVAHELSSPLDRNELAAIFALLDLNQDGGISFEEFRSWWQGDTTTNLSMV